MFRIAFYFIILWAMVLAFSWLISGQGRESAFRHQLAALRRGRLQSVLIGFFRPLIVFRYGNVLASIDLVSRRHQWELSLRMPWQAPPYLHLEICSEWSTLSRRRLAEMLESIELPGLGVPKVWAYPANVAKKQLGMRGSWELSRIVGSPSAESIDLIVQGDRWQLKGILKSEDAAVLDRWIQMALVLYDQMHVQAQSEVAFVEDVPQLINQANCGVCGQDIQESMVCCKQCKAPHHHDCWNYAGRCSTFGCAESECLSVQESKVIDA